jgi:alpha-glucosidase
MLALLACLPGTVCLYQGEELGLPQAEVPFDRLQDPFGKTFWPAFKGRDGCRTPMPWTSEAQHAGFTAAEPWLPVDERHFGLSVSAQEACAKSVLSLGRQVFALRRRHAALARGAIAFLAPDVHLLAFVRTEGEHALVCVFNLSEHARKLSGVEHSRALLSEGFEPRSEPGGMQWKLEPCGFAIFEVPVSQIRASPLHHGLDESSMVSSNSVMGEACPA